VQVRIKILIVILSEAKDLCICLPYQRVPSDWQWHRLLRR